MAFLRDNLVWRWLAKRPGLLLLISILVLISLSIIKPDFYLMGWDNFSSYLNPQQNFFNTFFTAWRQHRGLGVPSDAESADLFRQSFSFIATFIFGKMLSDQLYMVFVLWGGVLGMYFLGRWIANHLRFSMHIQEVFGFVSAFFYLFNLSTLSVFYFPMVMYNTRFFMLPTTLLSLLSLSTTQKISKLHYFVYCLLIVVGTGSFIVPTIFIVFMLGLGLFPLFLRKFLHGVQIVVFFILLNSYWILMFTNYTVQKATVVPQAPTFVEINESMLNKPKSFFAFERQAKLRPSFFESEFTNIAKNNQATPFHSLAKQDEQGINRIIFWIFPALYLLGILYNIFIHRNRLIGWFSFITSLFLILSMKEYSLFGMLYGFISDHVPFANTIFRFGDTKFHAMIAFGGSICAAFLISSIFTHMEKRRSIRFVTWGAVTSLLIFSIMGFKTYFNGNFIGFFMYNRLPQAYWDMAKTINEDPEQKRVIQLPFDTHTYWKPYSWGYFGSSFLHFMLNKPLFDRTFEPASEEASQIHRQIIDIYHQATSVNDPNQLKNKALDLQRLLSSVAVKYIIDDQTISTNIDTRNIAYWGTITPIDSHVLLNYMKEVGLLTLVKEYSVSSMEDAKYFAKLYPYNSEKKSISYKPRTIYLYSLSESEPIIAFATHLDKVNSGYTTRILPRNMQMIEGHYIQDKSLDNNTLIFPFDGIKDTDVKSKDETLHISSQAILSPGTYELTSPPDDDVTKTQIADIYAQTAENSVTILIGDSRAPDILGTTSLTPRTYRSIVISTKRLDYSLFAVNDVSFPLVYSPDGSTRYVGAAMLHGETTSVRLMYPETVYNVNSLLRSDGSNPQCINDSYENPESHVKSDNANLWISGKNVSTCFTTPLTLIDSQKKIGFLNLEFSTQGSVQDLSKQKILDSGKQQIHEEIRVMNNPLVLNVCVKPEDSQTCINKETLFTINTRQSHYRIPLHGNFNNISNLLITFAIRSNQRQSYQTSLSNIILRTYSGSDAVDFDNVPNTHIIERYTANEKQRLSLDIPITSTQYTYNLPLNKQALLTGRDSSCETDGRFQTVKATDTGLLSYVIGCKNYTNKNVPFSSLNFYVWDIEYKHLSGAMPSFIIMDKYSTYSYNKLYPDSIPVNSYFSIPFQKPESAQIKRMTLSEDLSSSKTYSLHGFIYPLPELENIGNKELIIEHFSQNEGISEIRNISLIQVPENWAYSVLKKTDYEPLVLSAPIILHIQRILPFLMRVDIDSTKNEGMLMFNEQFDKQWILFGVSSYKHYKCDGIINCYAIVPKIGKSTLYLFYYPELFSFVGFAVLTISLLIGTKVFVNKPKASH